MCDNNSGVLYWINGVKVYLPMTPYNSQVSVMSHVIRSIQKSKNCLIESPTGTGKTLALLCASLAWLQDYNRKIEQERATARSRRNARGGRKSPSAVENVMLEGGDVSSSIGGVANPVTSMVLGQGENEQSFGESTSNTCQASAEESESQPNVPLDEGCTQGSALKKSRVFYCTRTHHQITQVVSELTKTIYGKRTIKMSILSSRKQSCVNETARRAPSISEACRELISSNSTKMRSTKCCYYNGMSQLDTHKKLVNEGVPPVWDVEDFIQIGKELKACPYYCSQKLAESAEIAFAPYNYVLNPLIAEQMKLCMSGSVLILDEAHNIEDVCRSSMSANISYYQLVACHKDLSDVCSKYVSNSKSQVSMQSAYAALCGFVCSFANWLKKCEPELEPVDFSLRQSIFPGVRAKKKLEDDLSMDLTTLKVVSQHFKAIMQSYAAEEIDYAPRMSEATSHILSSLLLILEHMLGDSCEHFVASISHGSVNEFEEKSYDNLMHNIDDDSKSTTLEKRHGISLDPRIVSKESNDTSKLWVNFLCLSPSIAFGLATKDCRSVVLASGTLSPIISFTPELGAPFDVIFQANNHLQPNQVKICSLSVDTKNKPIRMTYKYIDSFYLQDEIGGIILEICKIVPHGVLCFLPSYTVMDKFLKRWKNTSLYDRLADVKQIFIEQKGMSSTEAEAMLDHYFSLASSHHHHHHPHHPNLNGGLLFAVCRGRASEGIDFRDNRARAVIAVGIPYPNLKVLDIERKMIYNDKRRRAHNGEGHNFNLSGSEWYNIQAYRALNQALGRCIRHRNDWGSVILIDGRFDSAGRPQCPNFTEVGASNSYLSSWVRQNLTSYREFSSFLKELRQFMNEKTRDALSHSPFDDADENSIQKVKEKSQRKRTLACSDSVRHQKAKTYSIKAFVLNKEQHELEQVEDFIISRNTILFLKKLILLFTAQHNL